MIFAQPAPFGMPAPQMQSFPAAPPRAQFVPQAAPTRPSVAAVAQPTVAPRPKVRAVSADPTPGVPPRLALPNPEDLGIRLASAPVLPAAAPMAVDWNQVHARLDRLGVVNFRRDRLPQGGFRVTFTLPGAAALPGGQVEATGDTEASAVLAALQRAEAAATTARR
jgi:hypothetical protein